MAGLVGNRIQQVTLFLIAVSGLLILCSATPPMRQTAEQPPASYTGLRPDWVRLPPMTPAPSPAPTEVAPALSPEPSPPAEIVAPPPAETEPSPEPIAIAAAPPSPEAPPSETPEVAPPTVPETPTATEPAVTEGLDRALAEDIVEVTNQARLANGLSPLTENSALVAAAQGYADLHAHVSPNQLDHHLNGSSLDSRAEAEGYIGWTFLAENLVWSGFTPPLSPEGAVQEWLASSAHRDNMLNPIVTEIGVGCYVSAAGERPFLICVQDFGARG